MQINSYPRPIRITGQMQMGCLAVYILFLFSICCRSNCGMKELELHYRRRGRSNFQKVEIATISVRMVKVLYAGKKKHKHKLFGPDFPRTFLTLTPGCPGVKKFLPITGATGKRTFRCGRPRFSARTSMTRRVVEKLCTKTSLR